MLKDGVKVAGHRVHQMLIVLPLGTLITGVVFDVIHLVTGNAAWALISFWLIVVGVITALLAAVFGSLDFLSIPSNTRAKRVGMVHGVGNVIVVALFAVSLWLRRELPQDPPTYAFIFSFAGIIVGTVTAWLGGELVNRLGVGVYRDANPNAPSSLRTPKIVESAR